MATEKVTVDCACCGRPNLAAIDQLARAVLVIRRQGAECRLANASAELMNLIVFAGLADVLRVEVQRQPEQREQLGRIEEEGELSDQPVL